MQWKFPFYNAVVISELRDAKREVRKAERAATTARKKFQCVVEKRKTKP